MQCVWCTSMSFACVRDVCVDGHDLLREVFGGVQQPSAWAGRRLRGKHEVRVEGSGMASMRFESKGPRGADGR